MDEEAIRDAVSEEKDEFTFREEFLTHFAARPLCGNYTYNKTGNVADACGGFAQGDITTDWCIAYGFPRQAAFYFNKFGREGAKQLAHEFTRRGNHFCEIWHQAGPIASFQYTQADLDSFEPSEEFTEWMLGIADVQDVCFRRGDELLKLVPSNP